MQCPRCATILDDESLACPRCGYPVRPRHQVVHLELLGNAVEVLGWLVVMILATIVVIPGAWAWAAVCRWFCRNLRLSDGRKATFTGVGGEIVGWWIVAAICGSVSHRVGGIHVVNINVIGWDTGLGPAGDALIAIAQFLLGAFASWKILRWMVAHVEFDSGERFEFGGSWGGLLAWDLWVGVLVLTIIGWAWGLAGMYRWMAESTRSAKSALRFYGLGHQILWRTLVLVLLCILIIPIPWALLWYTRWLVQCTTIEGQLEA